MTSLALTRLSRNVRELWQTKTADDPQVKPIYNVLFNLFAPGQRQQRQALKSQPRKDRKPHQPYRHKAASHLTTSIPTSTFKYECSLCAPQKHPLYKFKNFSFDKKMEHVKTQRLCHNCLALGHKAGECRSHYRCRTCQGKHNSAIHEMTLQATTLQQQQQPTPLHPSHHRLQMC